MRRIEGGLEHRRTATYISSKNHAILQALEFLLKYIIGPLIAIVIILILLMKGIDACYSLAIPSLKLALDKAKYSHLTRLRDRRCQDCSKSIKYGIDLNVFINVDRAEIKDKAVMLTITLLLPLLDLLFMGIFLLSVSSSALVSALASPFVAVYYKGKIYLEKATWTQNNEFIIKKIKQSRGILETEEEFLKRRQDFFNGTECEAAPDEDTQQADVFCYPRAMIALGFQKLEPNKSTSDRPQLTFSSREVMPINQLIPSSNLSTVSPSSTSLILLKKLVGISVD